MQTDCVFLPQSSLKRQECLDHDQRLVALVSMVRHVEVRLKQQQQQSVGRSLIALDDTIRQTEVEQHVYYLTEPHCVCTHSVFLVVSVKADLRISLFTKQFQEVYFS